MSITINLKTFTDRISDRDFEKLCANNPEVKFEITKEGKLIELMSPTDDLDELQQKMTEYMSCGVKLGWLINPDDKQVEIYRVGQNKEVLNNPQSLSGEKLMPNLIVNLSEIF